MSKGHELWYRINKISAPGLGVDEEWRLKEDHPNLYMYIHTISLHIPIVICNI